MMRIVKEKGKTSMMIDRSCYVMLSAFALLSSSAMQTEWCVSTAVLIAQSLNWLSIDTAFECQSLSHRDILSGNSFVAELSCLH